MPRPRKTQETVKVTITASVKFAEYLDDLIKEEAYGSSRAEVAKALVWRSIEDLMHKGIIERRKSPQRRTLAK